MDSQKVEQTLSSIFKSHGFDVVLDHRLFNALLTDYLSQNPSELRLFKSAMQSSVLNFASESSRLDEKVIQQAINRLKAECFFSQDIAEFLVSCFLNARGKGEGLPKIAKPQPKPIENQKSAAPIFTPDFQSSPSHPPVRRRVVPPVVPPASPTPSPIRRQSYINGKIQKNIQQVKNIYKSNKLFKFASIGAIMGLFFLLFFIIDPFSIGKASVSDKFRIGSVVEFGPCEWIIVDVKDNQFLLLSKECVEQAQYHPDRTKPVNWATSTLRKWLNEEFIHEFTPSERRWINSAELSVATPNHWDSNNTLEIKRKVTIKSQDNIFILSEDEIKQVTNTLKENKAEDPYEMGYGKTYWLRSSEIAVKYDIGSEVAVSRGYGDELVYSALSGGGQDSYLQEVTDEEGVRPAMWVSKKAFDTKKASETIYIDPDTISISILETKNDEYKEKQFISSTDALFPFRVKFPADAKKYLDGIELILYDENGSHITTGFYKVDVPIVDGEFDYYFQVSQDCPILDPNINDNFYSLSPNTTYKYQISLVFETSRIDWSDVDYNSFWTRYKSEMFEFTTKDE